MLIFARPPSDPAPEFEPGLNLGSTPPPYLARFESRLNPGTLKSKFDHHHYSHFFFHDSTHSSERNIGVKILYSLQKCLSEK